MPTLERKRNGRFARSLECRLRLYGGGGGGDDRLFLPSVTRGTFACSLADNCSPTPRRPENFLGE